MFESRSEEPIFRRLVEDIMMDINGLPLHKGWAIHVLMALGLKLSDNGDISGVIVNGWRFYERTHHVDDLWRVCRHIWVHLRPNSQRDRNLFILKAIEQCIRDPSYETTQEDKRYLRDLEDALCAFGIRFDKYEQMLFPRHTPSGRDEQRLHTLLFQLQTGFSVD